MGALEILPHGSMAQSRSTSIIQPTFQKKTYEHVGLEIAAKVIMYSYLRKKPLTKRGEKGKRFKLPVIARSQKYCKALGDYNQLLFLRIRREREREEISPAKISRSAWHG